MPGGRLREGAGGDHADPDADEQRAERVAAEDERADEEHRERLAQPDGRCRAEPGDESHGRVQSGQETEAGAARRGAGEDEREDRPAAPAAAAR